MNEENKGSFGRFFFSFSMMCIGFYMLLEKITVKSNFAMSKSLYQMNAGGMDISITSGSIFIPLIIGFIWILYSPKAIWGWMITLISAAAMIMGVIMNTKLTLATMSAWELGLILFLAFGGLGWFLRESKHYS